MKMVLPSELVDVLHAPYPDTIRDVLQGCSLEMLRDLYWKNHDDPRVHEAQLAMGVAISGWDDKQVEDFLLNYLFEPPASIELRSKSPGELREILSGVYHYLFLEFDNHGLNREMSLECEEEMNEEAVARLLDYIESHRDDHMAVQSKSRQYSRAVGWAKRMQRGDLVIGIAEALSSHFARSRPTDLNLGETERTSEAMRRFWEQGRTIAREGLLAAKELGDHDKELGFLVDLSRLSGCLNDYETALEYARQELRLIRPDMMWRTARELRLLGNQASDQEHFLAARACYQMSLELFQELDNRYAMAGVVDLIAANETARLEKGLKAGEGLSDDLPAVIDSLWELGDALRETDLNQARVAGKETSSTCELLQQALEKLDSLN